MAHYLIADTGITTPPITSWTTVLLADALILDVWDDDGVSVRWRLAGVERFVQFHHRCHSVVLEEDPEEVAPTRGLVFHLDGDLELLVQFQPRTAVYLRSRRAWEVWRLDDNDNQLLMSTWPTRAEAQAEAGRYEAKGHKQRYWVEWTRK